MDNKLLMHVTYKVKEGKRNEFVQKVQDLGILTASRQETGNLLYDYYYSVDDDNSVLLVEAWTDAETQAIHCKTEHFKKLSELKNEYVESVQINKFWTRGQV